MAMYAAYASNLNPEQMMRRAPHSPLFATGWLRGWRLTFGGEEAAWEGALPTIVEDAAATVYVALYDVHSLDEHALDEWEGCSFGLYQKIKVLVETLEGQQTAWVYVLNGYEGGLPSARLIGMIADAAEAGGAPSEYVQALRERPCTSAG